MLISDRCSGNCARLYARELPRVVRRYARVVRTEVVRLGNGCTRLSFERSGTVLCVDPPASVCTSVANCFNIALILALERSFRILEVRWPRWVQVLPGYTVGSLGAFWTVQRLALLFGGGQ